MKLLLRLSKALPSASAIVYRTHLALAALPRPHPHPLLVGSYINVRSPLGVRTAKTAVKKKAKLVTVMSLELPPDRALQLTRLVDAFLRDTDINTVSVKKVRTHLANQVTYDILPYKQDLAKLIQERFDKILDEQEANGTAAPSSPSSSPAGTASPATTAAVPKKKSAKSSELIDEDARFAAKLHAELNSTRTRTTRNANPATVKKKKAAPKKKKSRARVSDSEEGSGEETVKKKRKINRNNPFNALQLLSEPLSEVVGTNKLSRPSTVKEIWTYVKANNLQDETDRRFIVCDDKLRAVFNSDRIHMFKMNKVLSSHFSPLPPEMQPKPEDIIDDAPGELDSEAHLTETPTSPAS